MKDEINNDDSSSNIIGNSKNNPRKKKYNKKSKKEKLYLQNKKNNNNTYLNNNNSISNNQNSYFKKENESNINLLNNINLNNNLANQVLINNLNYQNANFLPLNIVNNYNNYQFNLFNIINLNNKLNEINSQILEFNKLKEIGMKELLNQKNANNILLNNIINPFYNFNNNQSNFNYSNNNYDYLNNNTNYSNNFNYYNNNNLNYSSNFNNKNNNFNYPNNFNYEIEKKKTPIINKKPKIYIKSSNKKNNSNKAKTIEEKNIINLDDIISGKEKRTVVKIKPIPPHYSSFDISKLFDKCLKIENKKNQRIYKALYTPLGKEIGTNLGYCFVMMVKPKYVIEFYNTFNGKNFKKKNCNKIIQVIWAEQQGDDFLNMSDDPLKSPIIFKDIKIDDDD